MTKPKIKIDVVSDVVCPWCYIGKRRLEKAIAQPKAVVFFHTTCVHWPHTPPLHLPEFSSKNSISEAQASTIF